MILFDDYIYLLLPFLNNFDKYKLINTSNLILKYVNKQNHLIINTSDKYSEYIIPFYKNIKKLVVIIDNYNYKLINNICSLKFSNLKHVEFIPQYKYESDISLYLNQLNKLNIDYCLLNNSLKCFILNHPKLETIKIENSASISDFTVLLLIKNCYKLKSCNFVNCTRLTELSLNIVNNNFVS